SFSRYRMDEKLVNIDESIALAAMYAANHLGGVKAIIALTETGSTPRLMSRTSSQLPIYAFSRHMHTQRRVALYRGVHPVPFDNTNVPGAEEYLRAVNHLKSTGVLVDGDLVILSSGDTTVFGGTNTMKIMRVGTEISTKAEI